MTDHATTAPLVFLDTETTGLSLADDIWEFGAIRRNPDGAEEVVHAFVEHDPDKCANLPARFLDDHQRRYEHHMTRAEFVHLVLHVFRPAGDARAHVVGAVPNFDTERLAWLLARYGHEPPWHYHLIDVENLAVGYLSATAVGEPLPRAAELDDLVTPPWRSDDLSRACGVEPPSEELRHTALGDAEWVRRWYDAITGGPIVEGKHGVEAG